MAYAGLELEDVSMVFKSDGQEFTALAPLELQVPRGRFHLADRTVRLRQEHDLQHRRRAAAADHGPQC